MVRGPIKYSRMTNLQFIPSVIKGLFFIEPKPFCDDRGSFARVFCKEAFREVGLTKEIVQINHSITTARGSVRGMHYQNPPCAEARVIKCLRGKVFDVTVDIRAGSPTFLQWVGVELSAQKGNAVYIPEGFAHGFQTLEENSEMLYMHTQAYTSASEGAIRYNDPVLGIKWPLPVGDISGRDKKHPLLEKGYKGICL